MPARIAFFIKNEEEETLSTTIEEAMNLPRSEFQVQRLTPKDMIRSKRLSAVTADWLVVIDSPTFPVAAKPALMEYLRGGGNLVLLGGHPFQTVTRKIENKWFTKDEINEKRVGFLKQQAPDRILFDFESNGLENWSHSSNQPNSKTRLEIVEGRQGKCLKQEIVDLTAWDVHLINVPSDLSSETNYVSFWAKGDERTPQLMLELFEKDGSRWSVTVDLEQQWQHFAIGQQDFQPRKMERDSERTEEEDQKKLANAERLAFGLAVNFTERAEGNHTVWIDEIAVGAVQYPAKYEWPKKCLIPVFNDYLPVNLGQVFGLQNATGKNTVDSGLSFDIVSPAYEIIGFDIPGEAKFTPLWNARIASSGTTKCVAGMQRHYGGEYAGATWIAFGLSDPGFYAPPAFADSLKEIIENSSLREVEWMTEKEETRKEEMQDYPPFNYVLGTQTFGIKYQFTEQSRLVETAESIQHLGSNILKCYLGSRYTSQYKIEPDLEITTLTDLVRKEPSYRHVLQMPFQYYLFWAYPFSAEPYYSWRSGMTEEQRTNEYNEMYELTRYLLKEYSGSKKTFLMGHWEGDWCLLGSFSMTESPEPVAIQGMIDWLNIRQKAIEDAMRDTPHEDVDVYQYTEVNLVKKAMEGQNAVVNAVLPNTLVDYVSYSSYETTWYEEDYDQMRKRIFSVLDYIESQLPPKPIEGKRVFLGEFGYPIDPWAQDKATRATSAIALEWGCPFVLYWEIYCNEGQEGGGNHAGFWMIDNFGRKLPVYISFHRFFDHFKNYVDDYRKTFGRNPPHDEFREMAAEWLRLR